MPPTLIYISSLSLILSLISINLIVKTSRHSFNGVFVMGGNVCLLVYRIGVYMYERMRHRRKDSKSVNANHNMNINTNTNDNNNTTQQPTTNTNDNTTTTQNTTTTNTTTQQQPTTTFSTILNPLIISSSFLPHFSLSTTIIYTLLKVICDYILFYFFFNSFLSNSITTCLFFFFLFLLFPFLFSGSMVLFFMIIFIFYIFHLVVNFENNNFVYGDLRSAFQREGVDVCMPFMCVCFFRLVLNGLRVNLEGVVENEVRVEGVEDTIVENVVEREENVVEENTVQDNTAVEENTVEVNNNNTIVEENVQVNTLQENNNNTLQNNNTTPLFDKILYNILLILFCSCELLYSHPNHPFTQSHIILKHTFTHTQKILIFTFSIFSIIPSFLVDWKNDGEYVRFMEGVGVGVFGLFLPLYWMDWWGMCKNGFERGNGMMNVGMVGAVGGGVLYVVYLRRRRN